VAVSLVVGPDARPLRSKGARAVQVSKKLDEGGPTRRRGPTNILGTLRGDLAFFGYSLRAQGATSNRASESLRRCGARQMSFSRREDALDLPNVIDVVAGEHPNDVLDRLFAAFGMNSMVLPLFWRE